MTHTPDPIASVDVEPDGEDAGKKQWKKPKLSRLELGATASAPPQPGGGESTYTGPFPQFIPAAS